MTVGSAFASEAMGHELRGGVIPLSQGTDLTQKLFWSDTYSDLRSERFTSYRPNEDVTPAVAYGNKVLSRQTLTHMARELEAQGKRVVSGINGDYYVLATGAPLGMVITDGVLRSSSSWHLAVGFREDGSAFIGTPDLNITASFGGGLHAVTGGINKIRKLYSAADNTGGLTLLTSDFSDSTQNTKPGVDVILTPLTEGVGQTVTGAGGAELVQSEQLVVNGRMSYTVDQVLESEGSISIPEGKLVMSLNGEDSEELLAALRALQPGEQVDIEISSTDTRWTEAAQAVGAMYKLVTNGAIEQPSDSAAKTAWAERTARTAIGIKEDGTVIFYTMDGKQPGYSVGCTLTQVAMRLVELGCVEAASLDGGGSTTIGATLPGQSELAIQNRPSDGSPRANSVAVFLTTEQKPTGILGTFYVTPSDSLLLAGSSVQVTAIPLDTAYYPMEITEPLEYFIYSGDGTVSSSGLFTAGSESGFSQVTVSSGDASGVAAMSVVKTPDRIALSDEDTGATVASLNLSPGQQINLKADAVYKGMSLVSQDPCYAWIIGAELGSIDSEGILTAADESGSGTLTVSAGGTSVSIPVSIAGHVNTLETFEEGTGAFESTDTAVTGTEDDMEYVRFGRQSLRVDYQANEDGIAVFGAGLSISGGETHLSMWIYGDGSGGALSAEAADGSGESSSIPLAVLDFTGWRYISVKLPEGTESIPSFALACESGEAAGSFWIDHLTTGNQTIEDQIPPTVQISCSGRQITASVSDDVDQSFPAEHVALTYDGEALPASWDSPSHTLTAELPDSDGKAHRITVTAMDASGNLGRASIDIQAAGGNEVFLDMDGHWAAAYASFLYHAGVTSSVDPEALKFAPDRKITRGEFFAMTARWMGLDLAQYEEVELPFADADKIPDWALREIKAMYAMGILKGSDSGGVLTVNAGADISRAEAMTILGRTQAKGYGTAALDFSDADEVPEWAGGYVTSLVFQGVVAGANQLISPNKPITRGEVAKLLYTML